MLHFLHVMRHEFDTMKELQLQRNDKLFSLYSNKHY
jgi:hypothetical protein